ncbi:MAG TPA: hypothetical protein PKY77_10155 [Phycisphaerae bacterium]|nr:hypothetical protein [Phycisphaerae bacterium]HRY69940.1 hypothetical protein [Phycisphaerae bacterium]HSA27149.1 hypothetical protein [Phycisphaerae bacterium]
MSKGLLTTEDGALKPGLRYGLITVLVLGGVYLAYRALHAGSEPMVVSMACWTPGCGYTRSDVPQVGELVPGVCPKCGKTSVAPAYRCRACGTVNVWNTYRQLDTPDKCSKCGREARYGQ